MGSKGGHVQAQFKPHTKIWASNCTYLQHHRCKYLWNWTWVRGSCFSFPDRPWKAQKNNSTTILKWGYFLQHLQGICDTGGYKHHTSLKLTGDVEAWFSHIVVIRRRELHKCFMRYICSTRGTKGLVDSDKSLILSRFWRNKNTFPKSISRAQNIF